MPDFDPIQSVNCPNCNAPIEFPSDDATTVKCRFCGSVVERPARVKPEPPEPPETPRPEESYEIDLETPPGPTVKTGACAFWVITGLVVFLGALAWFIFSPSGLGIGTRMILLDTAVLLPAGEGGKPDVVVLAYEPDPDQYQIVRLSPADRKTDWKGATFKDIGDVDALAALGGRLFAAEGSNLVGYDLATGKPLWTAPLSDKLGYGTGALSAAGNTVLALTQDYTLQAFDAATGAPAWKRKLDGYTDTYTLLGGSAFVIDTVDGTTGLFQLDLSDGSVQKQISPVCTLGDSSESFSASSTILFDAAAQSTGLEESAYFFYGWYPGCVERWDLQSGKMMWQTAKEDGFSPGGEYQTLETPDTVYFSDRNDIWSVRKDDGSVSAVLHEDDYEITPLALAGDILVIRAKRTRGSTQYALWGVRPADGQPVWQYVFTKGAPIDPPDAIAGFIDEDQTGWTWHLVDGKLDLMEFSAQPDQVAFRSIDSATGAVTEGKTVKLPFDSDFYDPSPVLEWDGAVGWMLLENEFLGINIDTQTIETKYP